MFIRAIRITIMKKIALIALSAAVVPLAFVYLFVSKSVSDEILKNLRIELAERAFLVGANIDRFFSERERDLRILSQANVFETDNTTAIQKYVREVGIETPFLDDIQAVKLDGKLIASSKNHDNIGKAFWDIHPNLHSLFDMAVAGRQGDVFVSKEFFSNDGVGLMALSPITDESNGIVIKVLAARINLKTVEEIISDFNRRGIRKKSVQIVNNQGHVILSSQGEVASYQRHSDLSVNPDMLDYFAVQGRSGSAEYEDVDGEAVVAGFADMGEFGVNKAMDWSIVAIAPVEAALGPVYEFQKTLIFELLAVLFAVGALLIFVGRPILNNLQAIYDGATAFGRGNLDARILIKSNDEVGEIAARFNEMAEIRSNDEKRLHEVAAIAQKANLAKSEFLAHMSHELRTPLNSIIGFSEAMLNALYGKVGNEKHLGYIRDIHFSGQHLLKLINDVLDLSKVEAGELDLVEENFDINAALEDCLRMLRGAIEQRALSVRYAPSDELPPLRGDERLIKQILLNLLSNAVKYNVVDGKIDLSVRIGEDNALSIVIADTGPGIAPEDIHKVLEPFGQSRVDSIHTHEGTGLGLSLSKKLAELHDGALVLESKVGEGTTVTVKFPPERTQVA